MSLLTVVSGQVPTKLEGSGWKSDEFSSQVYIQRGRGANAFSAVRTFTESLPIRSL